MEGDGLHAEEFFGLEKVVNVAAGVVLAGGAGAVFIDGAVVFAIDGVAEVEVFFGVPLDQRTAVAG